MCGSYEDNDKLYQDEENLGNTDKFEEAAMSVDPDETDDSTLEFGEGEEDLEFAEVESADIPDELKELLMGLLGGAPEPPEWEYDLSNYPPMPASLKEEVQDMTPFEQVRFAAFAAFSAERNMKGAGNEDFDFASRLVAHALVHELGWTTEVSGEVSGQMSNAEAQHRGLMTP